MRPNAGHGVSDGEPKAVPFYHCYDCERNVGDLNEYWYMLRHEIWKQLCPEDDGTMMMCIACLERRADRKLNSTDFDTSILCNHVDSASVLLQARRRFPVECDYAI